MKPELRPNGSRRRPPGGWEKFTKEIEEHARKRRRAPQQSPAQLANLKRGGIVWRGGCTSTTRAGTRCQLTPVRGAERCHKHGGLLEVPAHQANVRALLEGRLQPAGHAEARRAFYTFDACTREAVTAALQQAHTGAQRRRRPDWRQLLAGAQALNTDDNGLAFRRWLSEMRTR